jgi:hypothetical protein
MLDKDEDSQFLKIAGGKRQVLITAMKNSLSYLKKTMGMLYGTSSASLTIYDRWSFEMEVGYHSRLNYTTCNGREIAHI